MFAGMACQRDVGLSSGLRARGVNSDTGGGASCILDYIDLIPVDQARKGAISSPCNYIQAGRECADFEQLRLPLWIFRFSCLKCTSTFCQTCCACNFCSTVRQQYPR